MNILFYQPYNQAVPYIESVVEQFANMGHQTLFVSHDVKGETHKKLEMFGCKTYSLAVQRKIFILYYYYRVFKLVRFCKVNEIDVVYSHFQEANLISVFAQYFCKSVFIITRHHTDCAFVDNNWREKWGDKIINRLARIYIATSSKVYSQIIVQENTNPSKVRLINYGYNFDNLPKVEQKNVLKIREAYSAKILLIQAARYIPEKRHDLLIDAVYELVRSGYNIKLLLLGKGPLEMMVKDLIQTKKLGERVFQLGFQLNVMDYFAAADLVVHFSLTEASNSAIKEAAFTDTPVAVCGNVGDFDDYIIHEKNGFILEKNDPISDFIQLIQKITNHDYNLERIGKQLHEDVVNRFDIKNVVHLYHELNQLR